MFVVLLALLATALAAYSLVRNGRRADDAIKWVRAERGVITEKAIAVGQFEPRQKFQVKSKISGLVRRCLIEVGQVVRAGDPLFEIAPDPTPQEVNDVDRRLEAAEASYARSRADYERAEQLGTSGLWPRAQVEAAREGYDLAKVALTKARQDRELVREGRLSDPGAAMQSIIRAPAAGTVLSRAVNPGDPVVPLTSYQPGTELATVADMRDLVFRGTVDEIDVGKMRVGLPARLKVGALPDTPVRGRVARIAPQAQQKEGLTLFDVEVELDPTTTQLRAGYSASADVVIREKPGVLLLPERLVTHEAGGRAYVEVLDPGATEPARVEVRLGLSDGISVEILSGLREGQQVAERPPREIS
jgi:HlyD family secretion protein